MILVQFNVTDRGWWSSFASIVKSPVIWNICDWFDNSISGTIFVSIIISLIESHISLFPFRPWVALSDKLCLYVLSFSDFVDRIFAKNTHSPLTGHVSLAPVSRGLNQYEARTRHVLWLPLLWLLPVKKERLGNLDFYCQVQFKRKECCATSQSGTYDSA